MLMYLGVKRHHICNFEILVVQKNRRGFWENHTQMQKNEANVVKC